MKRWHWWAPLVAFLIAGNLGAQEKTFTITITAGKHAYKNTPVVVPLRLPRALANIPLILLTNDNTKEALVGQLTAPGLLTEGIKTADADLARRDLHFILPSLAAGS